MVGNPPNQKRNDEKGYIAGGPSIWALGGRWAPDPFLLEGRFPKKGRKGWHATGHEKNTTNQGFKRFHGAAHLEVHLRALEEDHETPGQWHEFLSKAATCIHFTSERQILPAFPEKNTKARCRYLPGQLVKSVCPKLREFFFPWLGELAPKVKDFWRLHPSREREPWGDRRIPFRTHKETRGSHKVGGVFTGESETGVSFVARFLDFVHMSRASIGFRLPSRRKVASSYLGPRHPSEGLGHSPRRKSKDGIVCYHAPLLSAPFAGQKVKVSKQNGTKVPIQHPSAFWTAGSDFGKGKSLGLGACTRAWKNTWATKRWSASWSDPGMRPSPRCLAPLSFLARK